MAFLTDFIKKQRKVQELQNEFSAKKSNRSNNHGDEEERKKAFFGSSKEEKLDNSVRNDTNEEKVDNNSKEDENKIKSESNVNEQDIKKKQVIPDNEIEKLCIPPDDYDIDSFVSMMRSRTHCTAMFIDGDGFIVDGANFNKDVLIKSIKIVYQKLKDYDTAYPSSKPHRQTFLMRMCSIFSLPTTVETGSIFEYNEFLRDLDRKLSNYKEYLDYVDEQSAFNGKKVYTKTNPVFIDEPRRNKEDRNEDLSGKTNVDYTDLSGNKETTPDITKYDESFLKTEKDDDVLIDDLTSIEKESGPKSKNQIKFEDDISKKLIDQPVKPTLSVVSNGNNNNDPYSFESSNPVKNVLANSANFLHSVYDNVASDESSKVSISSDFKLPEETDLYNSSDDDIEDLGEFDSIVE